MIATPDRRWALSRVVERRRTPLLRMPGYPTKQVSQSPWERTLERAQVCSLRMPVQSSNLRASLPP